MTVPNHRKFWLPRLEPAKEQCASCPFRKSNDSAWMKVLKLMMKFTKNPTAITGLIAYRARGRIRGEVKLSGEFACHDTVYDWTTMKHRLLTDHRQCPGATAYYRNRGS